MSEFRVKATAYTAAFAMAIGMSACDNPESDSKSTKPAKLSRPIESNYNKGKLVHDVHTLDRDLHKLQRVVDYCLNGSYYRKDPLYIHYLDNFAIDSVPDHQFKGGHAANEACADDSLQNGDPMVPLPPADYPHLSQQY